MKSESVYVAAATVCLFVTTKMLAKPQSKKLAGPRLLKKYDLRNVFTAFDMIKFSKNLPQPTSHLTQVLAEKLTHIHTKQQTLLHTR